MYHKQNKLGTQTNIYSRDKKNIQYKMILNVIV
jgi:hypothetical protein